MINNLYFMIDVNVRITGDDIGIKSFVDYVRTLPFATVEEVVRPKKMSFEEAVVKYNCISVDEFFDKLEKQIEEDYKNV